VLVSLGAMLGLGSWDAVPVSSFVALSRRASGGAAATTGWACGCSAPRRSGSVKSWLKRLCPLSCLASNSTSATSVTPINTPKSFGMGLRGRRRSEVAMLSGSSSSW